MPVDALWGELRFAERRLIAAEERVAYCRTAAAKASAVLGGECVSRTRDVASHENAVIRLMEAERAYAEAEREYSDLRDHVCSLLQRLDDAMNANVLKLRHVENKRMSAIANELHLSRSSVYLRYSLALAELKSVLQMQDGHAGS